MEASAVSASATETPTTITSLNNDTTQESVQEVPLERQSDEAAAAAAATTITSFNDETTQEKVQDVYLESSAPVPLVDGGEVGVAVTLNENDEDVHATMASTLPNVVIVQSNWNNRYLRLESEHPNLPNALQFGGDYSFGLETRYELLPATSGTGLVHIRSLHNNKYWVISRTRVISIDSWITATAVKPEENQSDRHCTLFQPVFVYSNNNRVVRLRHVHTGKFVFPYTPRSVFVNLPGCLSLEPTGVGADLFTFLDWGSVLVLPDLIRIKNMDNQNHLMARSDDYLDFRSRADNSSWYDYEVIPSRNGGVRLKSVSFDTYCTEDNSTYILLRNASTTFHDINTVFIPTLLSGNRVLFRCLRSNNICKRYSVANRPAWSNLFSARANYPDSACYMEIEEPVDSRTISNVRYHLADARIYNERTTGLVTDETVNRLDVEVTSELNLTEKVVNTTNWSRSVTLTVGVTTGGSAGIPFVADGSIEISTEVANSWEWGVTKQEDQEVGSVRTVVVPPMSRVMGTLMATRLSYDVPFSYTQRDVLKNGNVVVFQKDDGVFTGHNGYGYYYEIVPLPLD
ncbi:uncharacterized protein LOC113337199 [Papaver somniferum]|uniref:uncharacterized protein LOC113337199 n=1 Tax=Papaver somniferum TaxID=3469 RepID=UPI000E700B7A|nr:uncharacterized protein LOC113337199 [Papaver somniferum]